MVCFIKTGFERVRIITARKPTRLEKKDYEDSKRERDMKSEYRFDYSKARPNRFAAAYKKGISIANLESDVAENFPDSESVKDALRNYIRITRENNPEVPVR